MVKILPFDIIETNAKRPFDKNEDEITKRQGMSDPSLALAKAALASGQLPSSDGAIQVCVAPKALKTTIEFIVPGFKVGLIIGKSGETLKRLEKISDCRITFSPLTTSNPADMPERKVFVTGLPDDVEHCKRLVLEKINEGPPTVIAAGATPPPMPPGTVVPVQLPNGVSLQVPIHRDEKGTILPMEHLFVPNNKVGLIIGKGGETIKDLQDRSGARVYIAPDASMTADFSTERFIAVSGPPESIIIAKQLLEDVLEGRTMPIGSSTEIGKITVSLVMPDELVGMVIGRKGDYFKWMMTETRCRISAEPPVSDGRPNREIVITGPPEGVAYAQALIHDKLSGCARLDPSGTTYSIAEGSAIQCSSSDFSTVAYPFSDFPGPAGTSSFGVPTSDSPRTSVFGYNASLSSTSPYSTDGFYNQSVEIFGSSTDTSNPMSGYSQDQLISVFNYYNDYYLNAGLDAPTAQSAALSAMTSAGISHPVLLPAESDYTTSPNAPSPNRSMSKETSHGNDNQDVIAKYRDTSNQEGQEVIVGPEVETFLEGKQDVLTKESGSDSSEERCNFSAGTNGVVAEDSIDTNQSSILTSASSCSTTSKLILS